jgi:protoporphyrin/coproporphyrin ferrochelatase
MADGTRVGVLLLQLGTPAAPTPAALRTYLREFLSDRRVIDLPRAVWLPILLGIVLRTRPRASARLYQKIWTPEGSPLAVTTARQAQLLEARLRAAGQDVRVLPAMRYGEPSIAQALSAFAADGIDRLLAFPMYPQYAGATTGSSLERVFALTQTARVVPSIRVVPPYFADAHYINALATVTRESVAALADPPERCLLSFHGLPARFATEGDPYPVHCKETARLLEHALNWPATKCMTTFQSRFGREEWLQPYTDRVLEEMGRAGTRVAVACPGFTADCLETLEEIGIRAKDQFLAHGGEALTLVPSLNAHPSWVRGLTQMLRQLRSDESETGAAA